MSPEENPSAILARIDERTRNMAHRMDDFVTKEEFSPVKSLTYGCVGLILTAFVVALVALVMK